MTDAARTDRRDANPAFAGFYVRERTALIRAVAFAIGDPALAVEAVDEAMARAFERWDKVAAYDNPAGWVYRVALNWARSAWRKRSRVRTGDVPDHGTDDPVGRDPALWAAVAALPEKQRDVVVLRFLLDWDIRQIAEAMTVPEGTIKSRVSRGLDALRTHLATSPEVAS